MEISERLQWKLGEIADYMRRYDAAQVRAKELEAKQYTSPLSIAEDREYQGIKDFLGHAAPAKCRFVNELWDLVQADDLGL
jgi:hypothetical protein